MFLFFYPHSLEKKHFCISCITLCGINMNWNMLQVTCNWGGGIWQIIWLPPRILSICYKKHVACKKNWLESFIRSFIWPFCSWRWTAKTTLFAGLWIHYNFAKQATIITKIPQYTFWEARKDFPKADVPMMIRSMSCICNQHLRMSHWLQFLNIVLGSFFLCCFFFSFGSMRL